MGTVCGVSSDPIPASTAIVTATKASIDNSSEYVGFRHEDVRDVFQVMAAQDKRQTWLVPQNADVHLL